MEAGLPGALNVDSLDDNAKALRRKTHETIQKVSDDFGRRHTFNTAIAAVMELINDVSKFDGDAAVKHEALEAAVLVLAPITPTPVMHCGRPWAMMKRYSMPPGRTWTKARW